LVIYVGLDKALCEPTKTLTNKTGMKIFIRLSLFLTLGSIETSLFGKVAILKTLAQS
jgi:hypothetical protein